ncbi:putative methyltransferase [Chlorella vulgaris]
MVRNLPKFSKNAASLLRTLKNYPKSPKNSELSASTVVNTSVKLQNLCTIVYRISVFRKHENQLVHHLLHSRHNRLPGLKISSHAFLLQAIWSVQRLLSRRWALHRHWHPRQNPHTASSDPHSSIHSGILAFVGEGLATRDQAVDVATGSGQVAVASSELFAAVAGCDSSEGQLSHAVQRPNKNSPLIQAALTWFDVQKFYSEAARVLKPSGVLAVAALAAANSQLEELYSGTLRQYWDERRALVDGGYQAPAPDADWSAYAKFRRCNPDAEDPLVPFKKRLMDTLQLKDDASDGALVMRSAVPLILAQGPGTVKAVVPAEECKQWRGQGCFLWTVDVWIGWHAQQSGAACRCTLWKPRCAWG